MDPFYLRSKAVNLDVEPDDVVHIAASHTDTDMWLSAHSIFVQSTGTPALQAECMSAAPAVPMSVPVPVLSPEGKAFLCGWSWNLWTVGQVGVSLRAPSWQSGPPVGSHAHPRVDRIYTGNWHQTGDEPGSSDRIAAATATGACVDPASHICCICKGFKTAII